MVAVLEVEGEALSSDPVKQGNELVERHLAMIRDELIDLRRVSLSLHAESLREELAEAELEGKEDMLRFLQEGDRFLHLPVAEFRDKVKELYAFIDRIDPKRKTCAARQWDKQVQQMSTQRQAADLENEQKEDKHADSTSRSLQTTKEKEFQEKMAPFMNLSAPYMPNFCILLPATIHLDDDKKRSLYALERTKLLTEVANVEFCFVPGGTYPVGLDPARAAGPNCLFERGAPHTHNLPAASKKIDGFFITKQPLHYKQLLKLSSAVLRFPKIKDVLHNVSLAEMTSVLKPAQTDFTSEEERMEYTGGFGTCQHIYQDTRKVLKDGVAHLRYYQAKAIAEALGCTLPSYEQHDIAARGVEQHLYPWGNELDPQELYMKQGKLLSFGRYAAAHSPFGLENLARSGCEWNSLTPTDLTSSLNKVYSSQDDPPTSHCLRSISDYTGTSYDPNETDEFDQEGEFDGNFTGPSLPSYGKPNRGIRRAACRLVVSLGVGTKEAVANDSVEVLIPLLGGAEWGCLPVLGRVEERFETKNGSVLCYYSQGLAIHCVSGVAERITLHSGPTRDLDFETCKLRIETGNEQSCTLSTLAAQIGVEGTLPESLTRSCCAKMYSVPRDEYDTSSEQSVTLALTPL